MPLTPFHLGPGLLLTVGAGTSFTAFLVVNVVIDIESGYHLATGAYPVHTFLHTTLGATIVALVTIAGLAAVERWRRRRRPHNTDGTLRASTSDAAIAGGALAGAWSHVILDGVMHDDARPLAPWSDGNPLHDAISLTALHAICVACAIAGIAVFLFRRGRIRG